jgi:hypothetical protein
MTTASIPDTPDTTHTPDQSIPFTDLYLQLTGREFDAQDYRASLEDTEIIPAVGGLLPLIEDRITQLEALGDVHVTVDPNFTPTDCEWCALEPAQVTSVRVTGRPHDGDLHNPLIMVETCHKCAVDPRHGPIMQALTERANQDRDLEIEVSE